MLPNQLQKAFDLSKKTGDRLIVFDSSKSNEAYVIMNLDEYEKIIIGHSEIKGLTEDELLDKINRDIAIWKSERNFSDLDNDFGEENTKEPEAVNDIIEEKRLHNFTERKSKNNWRIPRERKESAEDIEDEIEEDRHYLEEVPF